MSRSLPDNPTGRRVRDTACTRLRGVGSHPAARLAGEARALAAPVLSPGPDERVLDLCAAPGGKATHLAERMGDRGCLVASDVDEGRLRGLLGNLYRLAHPAVLTLSADGRAFPGGARFDRVLVDAPCSAEGNLRDRGGELRDQPEGFRDYVTTLQEKLLRRAVDLARPGGEVLYVTCTFAPEENEAVVDAALRERPVSVAPIDLEVPRSPGLRRFGERRFHPDLERACRLYPHHLNSGGLFMALLRKEGTAGPGPGDGLADGDAGGDASDRRGGAEEGAGAAGGWSPVPAAYPADELDEGEAEERIREGRTRFREEFGVPASSLDDVRWLARQKSLWGHRCDAWPLRAWEPGGDWRFLTLGLRALREDPRFGRRPTNDALRWLGDELGERVVALDASECLQLLDGEGLAVGSVPAGVAALRLEGHVVGRGVVRNGELRHEIPKGRAGRLADVLKARDRGTVSPAGR